MCKWPCLTCLMYRQKYASSKWNSAGQTTLTNFFIGLPWLHFRVFSSSLFFVCRSFRFSSALPFPTFHLLFSTFFYFSPPSKGAISSFLGSAKAICGLISQSNVCQSKAIPRIGIERWMTNPYKENRQKISKRSILTWYFPNVWHMSVIFFSIKSNTQFAHTHTNTVLPMKNAIAPHTVRHFERVFFSLVQSANLTRFSYSSNLPSCSVFSPRSFNFNRATFCCCRQLSRQPACQPFIVE